MRSSLVALVLVWLLLAPGLSVAVQEGGGGSWTTMASMPTARKDAATAVARGQILVMGGYKEGAGVLSVVEGYSVDQNRWVALPSMPMSVLGAAVTVVADRYVTVFGGFVGFDDFLQDGLRQVGNVNVFDLDERTWTTRTPIPTPRGGAVAVAIDNVVYVIGGLVESSPRHLEPTDIVEVYDFGNDSWVSSGMMPTPRGYSAAGLLDGRIIVVGGHGKYGPTNVSEAYSVSTGSWDILSSAPFPAKLGSSKTYVVNSVAGAVATRDLYVIASTANRDYIASEPLGSTVTTRFKRGSDEWSIGTPMPTRRSGFSAATDGKSLYLMGGFDPESNRYFTANEVYTPAIEQSAPTASPSVPRAAGGGGQPRNIAPFARFTAATRDLLVSVDATSSVDVDGRIVNYAWTFGDGLSENGPVVQHAYPTEGTYTVGLTVRDDLGGIGSFTQTVRVTESSVPAPSTKNSPASFDLLVVAVLAGLLLLGRRR